MVSGKEGKFIKKELKMASTNYATHSEIKTGSILYSSWGYSMCLVNFYKVIGRTEKRLYLQELKEEIVSGDSWHGHVMPADQIKKDDKLKATFSRGCFRIDGHRLQLFDGKPKMIDTLD